MSVEQNVEIFTDGACSGNPGLGGWGAILRYDNVEKELSGFSKHTTNNRMELLAAISALESSMMQIAWGIIKKNTGRALREFCSLPASSGLHSRPQLIHLY